jgi:hypothetical protein
MKDLKVQYEKVCNEYVKRFCEKHDLEFGGWVAGIVGDIASYGDFYFSFQDVVWDINSKQPKGLIIKWYDEVLLSLGPSINYYSYTKGLRTEHLGKRNHLNN